MASLYPASRIRRLLSFVSTRTLLGIVIGYYRQLENEIGRFFDRNAEGSFHQKALARQTADRTVHKGDLTGIEIINRLMEEVLANGVGKMQEHRAVGLIPTKDRSAFAGVLMIDMRTGKTLSS